MVPLAEFDYTWVRGPSGVLTVGERVNVQLLALDPAECQGLASIKRALLATPREGIALRAGDPPYRKLSMILRQFPCLFTGRPDVWRRVG